MLDYNWFTHHNTYAILREATSETYGPWVYLLSYLLPIYFYLHLYFLHLYYKIPKIYWSYHIISIKSHFRKWPWRDWRPLYCVGCEVLVCLCRCVGLLRSLLLDWYLGSQKLREILTLLCCITLSSSRKTNASSRRSAVAGEVFAQVKTYQVPITNSSPSHYIIYHLHLIFLTPTSPLPFYLPSLSQSPPLFFACLLLCACLLVWPYGRA